MNFVGNSFPCSTQSYSTIHLLVKEKISNFTNSEQAIAWINRLNVVAKQFMLSSCVFGWNLSVVIGAFVYNNNLGLSIFSVILLVLRLDTVIVGIRWIVELYLGYVFIFYDFVYCIILSSVF